MAILMPHLAPESSQKVFKNLITFYEYFDYEESRQQLLHLARPIYISTSYHITSSTKVTSFLSSESSSLAERGELYLFVPAMRIMFYSEFVCGLARV